MIWNSRKEIFANLKTSPILVQSQSDNILNHLNAYEISTYAMRVWMESKYVKMYAMLYRKADWRNSSAKPKKMERIWKTSKCIYFEIKLPSNDQEMHFY